LHPEHTYKTAFIECDVDTTPVVCKRQVSGDQSEPVCVRWPAVAGGGATAGIDPFRSSVTVGYLAS
jgi:hypothetical protein